MSEEDDDPRITPEQLDEIVAQACAPGITSKTRGGKLLAGWRSHLGTDGPGLVTRLMMARQVEQVCDAAVSDLTRQRDELAKALRQCQAYLDNCEYIRVVKNGVPWPNIHAALALIPEETK